MQNLSIALIKISFVTCEILICICCFIIDPFYNKPLGIKHWLQFAQPPIPKDTIIIIVDPDMFLMRPIAANVLVSKGTPPTEVMHRVSEGHPVAQTYQIGAPWTDDKSNFNR